MTNGGKLQSIFPNLRITLCESYVQVMSENYEFSNTYPLKWWNAEYKNDKVDCEHTDCNNCVNHKYCDYESNKSEVPTGSDDCISRFEVTEILNSEYDIDKMLDRVDELPPVTPIRPKGRWIDHSDEGYVECPKCGSATNCDDNINDLHFCFSCGADMREVKE